MNIRLRPRHLLLAVRLPALTALGLLLLLDLWFETVGVPGFLRQAVVQAAERQGIVGEIPRLRAGIWRGLVVDELTVWDGDLSGRRLLTARRVRCRLRKLALLRGRLRLSRLEVAGGTLFFPTPTGEDKLRRSPFVLHSLDLQVDLSPDRLSVEHCDGILNGIKLELDGEIVGLRGPQMADRPAGRFGWHRLNEALPEELREWLIGIKDYSASQLPISDDALVRGRLAVQLDDWRASRGTLVFQLADLAFRQVPIRKFKGRLLMDKGVVRLENATLDIGAASFISGTAEYDLAAAALSAALSGALDPFLFYRLLEQPMPQALAEMTFAVPPRFSLVVEPGPWQLADWRLAGELTANNVLWSGAHVRQVGCRVRRQPGRLEVEDFSLHFDRAGNEAVVFRGVFDERTRSASGKMEATVHPRRFERYLPADWQAVRAVWRDLRFGSEIPRFSATCDKLCLSPFEVRGSAALEVLGFRYRDLPAADLRVPLVFDGAKVATAPEGLRLELADGQSLRLEASGDVQQRTLAVKGAASLHPDRLYRDLRLPSDYYAEALDTGARPVVVAFELSETPWPLANWQVQGRLEAREGMYDILSFERATAGFTVDPQAISFQQIEASSRQFDELSFPELKYSWAEQELTFRGRGRLDPRLIAVFINPRGRHHFEDIWSEMVWGASPPAIEASSFQYKYFHSGAWQVNMRLTASNEGFVFRGVPTDTVRAEVVLRLPQAVEVREIVCTRGESTASGSVTFDLAGESMLSFTCQGTFDPVAVFGTAAPGLGEALGKVSAGGDTTLSLDGQVYLRGRLRPHIRCQMQGSHLGYDKMAFSQFTADWQLDNHEFKWRLGHAVLADGMVVASGYHNAFTDTGRVEARFRDLDIEQLIGQVTGKAPTRGMGKLSGLVELDSAMPTGANLPLLNGSGKLRVRDGDFYRTPLVQSLVGVVGVKGVGQISEIDADFELRGNHLDVSKFQTDGTLLALSGKGRYFWDRDPSLDFIVSGQVLRATSLIPLLTRPLSWFFEAELGGNLATPEWRMRSPLRAILPGRGRGEEGGDDDLFEMPAPRPQQP